ncbi:MAG: hypothetical protein ACWGSQ_19240 [Longimicrobiales bacterium]
MLSRTRIARTSFLPMALGVLFLTLAGPASAQEAPKKVASKPDKDAVKLVVENNNYLDMHVYGMRDGYYRSLGMVTGLSKAEFTIPESLTLPGGDFQILADPIGGTLSYQTDPIVISTSKEIDLLIQNNLALSSFTLR